MKRTRNRRRPDPVDPVEAEIAELRARAAALGIRFAGERLTSFLPQARCTPEERERAQKFADDQGISLSEHVRRRAILDPHAILVVK